jgi:tetratricopeptide (TPR) repeat protein
MALSMANRLFRDKTIREAEGYLELLMACADRWELEPAVRDPLGTRVLGVLMRLDTEDRRSPHVLYLQGLAYRAMERYDEAILPLREAAERRPENIHVWLTLGWCFKRTGRLQAAIESLQEALAIDPRQAILHYNVACYWSLAGHTELALEHLAIAFDLGPEYRELAADEPDFDPIRGLPSFRELTNVIV